MADTRPTTPNESLIRELKGVLALVESGELVNAVIVAAGPKLYHRSFNIPAVSDVPMMIGEVAIFQSEMEFLVLKNRTEQVENRKGLVGLGVRQ